MKNKYSYLINQNITRFCSFESENYNTECWIIRKKKYSSNLDTSYIFKTNGIVRKIKISSKNFSKKDKIIFLNNDIFLVYLQIKKDLWNL